MRTRSEFLRYCLAAGATAAVGAPSRAFAQSQKLTGTINYLTYESLPTTKKVLAEQFAAFEKANPGVTINPLLTSPEGVRKQVSSMLQSGMAPDVVNLDIEDAMLYSHSGLLEPVTDIVNSLAGIPDRWRARSEGQDFFVPNGVKFTYTWYRSDLFEKAGLQPPKTWGDFEAAAAKFTAGGEYGYVVTSNETGDEPVSMLFSYAFSNGVNFLDDDGSLTFDHGPDRQGLIETLSFLKAMSKYSPNGATFQWGDVINAFASGKVAMADYIGARLFDVVLQNNPDLAKVTKPMIQPYGKQPANRLSAEGYMIFAGSKNKEAAKTLIRYLHSGQHYLDFLWSIPLHCLPVAKEAFLGPYQNDDFVEQHQDIVRVIAAAWDQSWNPVYDLRGQKAIWQRAKVYTSTVYNKMIANVIQGGIDPGKAVDQAAAAARSLIKAG